MAVKENPPLSFSRHKRFYTGIFFLLSVIFILISYVAVQQTQVYRSKAAESGCSRFNNNPGLCEGTNTATGPCNYCAGDNKCIPENQQCPSAVTSCTRFNSKGLCEGTNTSAGSCNWCSGASKCVSENQQCPSGSGPGGSGTEGGLGETCCISTVCATGGTYKTCKSGLTCKNSTCQNADTGGAKKNNGEKCRSDSECKSNNCPIVRNIPEQFCSPQGGTSGGGTGGGGEDAQDKKCRDFKGKENQCKNNGCKYCAGTTNCIAKDKNCQTGGGTGSGGGGGGTGGGGTGGGGTGGGGSGGGGGGGDADKKCKDYKNQNSCKNDNNCKWFGSCDKCGIKTQSASQICSGTQDKKCKDYTNQNACSNDNNCKWFASCSACAIKTQTEDVVCQAECQDDSQCAAGEICKDNKCEENPTEGKDVKLALRLSFQGITKKPSTTDKLAVKVTLRDGGLDQPVEKSVEFTADDSGIWSGTAEFSDVPIQGGYAVLVKGAKHVQKRICDATPTEASPNTYTCSTGNITLAEGENALNFSGIRLPAGDLPTQDGQVNANDIALILTNLGSKDGTVLAQADLNLDGIVDTQDYALVIAALSVKLDEQ